MMESTGQILSRSGYDLATDSWPIPVLPCPRVPAPNRSPRGRNTRGGILFALFPVTSIEL
jgi:hypothetical protein